MKLPVVFREYLWLVNTISRHGRITMEKINQLWMEEDISEGKPIPRTTFYRHKDAIQDMFGVYIECDRTNQCNEFYIGNERVLHEDSIQNWMLSTLSVNSLISESLTLQNRILLEKIPSDGNYLKTTIAAMKAGVRVKLVYQRYGSDDARTFTVDPYCIKLFRQRWYVLGHYHRVANEDHSEEEVYLTFSFDRIKELELTNDKFSVIDDFDADTFFSECWGVLVGDNTPVERVVLRAYDYERFYLRDLPMHRSQKEIAQGEGWADFELNLRPTSDFSNHLLSRGAMLKVLEPQWLADEIRDMHRMAADMYDDEAVFTEQTAVPGID